MKNDVKCGQNYKSVNQVENLCRARDICGVSAHSVLVRSRKSSQDKRKEQSFDQNGEQTEILGP